MKTLAKIGLGCGAVFLFFIVAIIICWLIYYFNSGNWIARSPERICKEMGFKLPAYKVLEEEDNMDRDSSSWAWYYWRVKLKKPLSKKDIHKLEKLVEKDPNWHRFENNIFEYRNYKESWEADYDIESNSMLSPQVYIKIDSDNEVSINYMWYDTFF